MVAWLQPFGEDVAVTLRTADGDVYTWDGEVSYGIMERSIPVDQLEA